MNEVKLQFILDNPNIIYQFANNISYTRILFSHYEIVSDSIITKYKITFIYVGGESHGKEFIAYCTTEYEICYVQPIGIFEIGII
jgi:hypothetical protein